MAEKEPHELKKHLQLIKFRNFYAFPALPELDHHVASMVLGNCNHGLLASFLTPQLPERVATVTDTTPLLSCPFSSHFEQ